MSFASHSAALSQIFCPRQGGEGTDASPSLLEIQALKSAKWKFSLPFFPPPVWLFVKEQLRQEDLAILSSAGLTPLSRPRTRWRSGMPSQSPDSRLCHCFLSVNWSGGQTRTRRKVPDCEVGLLHSSSQETRRSEWPFPCSGRQGQSGGVKPI